MTATINNKSSLSDLVIVISLPTCNEFQCCTLSLSTYSTQFPRTASAAPVNQGCHIGRLSAIPVALSSAHWLSFLSSVLSAVEDVENKKLERKMLGVGRG